MLSTSSKKKNAKIDSKSDEKKDLRKTTGLIKNLLLDSKAENVAIYEVATTLAYCDFIVIATGTSSLHLKALYEKIRMAMKKEGLLPFAKTKSIEENYWHILDYTDIVIHLILKENRDFYKLDELFEQNQDNQKK